MNEIWHQRPSVDKINRELHSDTIMDHLGIEITAVGDDWIRGTMPADKRTFQPYGVIHGGANVVLTETLGSVAGIHCVDQSKYQVFGQEVSASHLRPVSNGLVTGTARAIHLGRRTQVWEIRVEDEQGRLSCHSKLTMAIVEI